MEVAACTVYLGVPVFDNNVMAPAKKLEARSHVLETVSKVLTHPLVVVTLTKVSFPDVLSFSNKIFGVIAAFDVLKLREELVINVPWILSLEV